MKTTTMTILGALLLAGCAAGPSPKAREAYVVAHPDMGADVKDAIEAGEIMRGMNKDQVKAAWGSPCGYCYGTTQNSYGDTWEYNVFGSANPGAGTYVFFDQTGRVTGWSGN